LLLERFLIVAESVVIADLPQHAGVRADRRGNRNGADNGKNGDAIDQVSRYDELAQLAWRRRNKECIALTLHKNDQSPSARVNLLLTLLPTVECGLYPGPPRTSRTANLDRKPRSASVPILDSAGRGRQSSI